MKFKYYLRGLGIGIILTTIILTISNSGRELELTDEEIIQRAEALGMVMEEDSLFPNKNKEDEPKTENSTETMLEAEQDMLKENSEISSKQETETENSQEVSQSEIVVENSETVSVQENIAVNSEIVSEDGNSVEDNETKAYKLTIYPGFTANSISRELEKNGVIADRKEFVQYLVEIDYNYTRELLVGEYKIPYGLTMEEIYEILKAGPL